VHNPEFLFAALLAALLVALAGFYAWRQIRALRTLRNQTELPREDRRYIIGQACRRLFCSVLMVALAGLLFTTSTVGKPVDDLIETGKQNVEKQQRRPLAPEERQLVDRFTWHIIALLLVLLVLLVLAGVDFLAIRRYGRRHYHQIQTDRKAMIERQLARLRSQRNGHT
jgi:hypothetical protein